MSGSQELRATVESAWNAFREQIDGVDLSAPVYTDPVWTVRDILAHCALCANDAVKVMEAHQAGAVYVVDTGGQTFEDSLDAHNQQGVDATRALTDHEIRERWIAGQIAFTNALRALDDDAMSREIACPWRDPTPVPEWVMGDLAHERGHIAGILAAVTVEGATR